MPKVRILSGSQTGAVVDLPAVEALAAIDSGYAEPYTEPLVPARPVTKPRETRPTEK